MARIQKTSLSPDFTDFYRDSLDAQEHNDCSVKAIALVTGRTYTEVRAALKAAGRKDRSGTPQHLSIKVLQDFGYTVRNWSFGERITIMNTYPGADTTACNRSITTHHWRRFPKSWAPHWEKKLIVITSGHMLAVVDGVVKDWTINRSLRVLQIWEVS